MRAGAGVARRPRRAAAVLCLIVLLLLAACRRRMDAAVRDLRRCGVVGLDTEWGAGRRVELSDGAACVVDVAAVPAFRDLLADPARPKVGCGVRQDLELLRAQFGLPYAGVAELGRAAARHGQ
eukprot:gene47176-58483_t